MEETELSVVQEIDDAVDEIEGLVVTGSENADRKARALLALARARLKLVGAE